jgi:predicted amidohydrolase YtcJ
MSYSIQHASALASMIAKGAAVSFRKDAPGTEDPLTGLFTGASSASVAGYAIEVKGDQVADRSEAYLAGEMITQDPATLFFVPSTYGSLPDLGAVCTWSGSERKVKQITPMRPDGTAIAARVVVV